ncbi:MAG TPA: nucleotidyl transferase AbiEii/AbiGii toxin family protein [Acidimicrobiia bacterium]|nr:nucleotidyl transferase AbiEii/AbiGii toxin family protein [Acidimicrobiia bacterium]
MTTNVPTLPEKVVSLARALEESELPYAFGGALALAYYAEPRATVDIDVNVFVSPKAFRTVVKALEPLGVEATDTDRRSALRDGQVRLWWGNTPVDLFFATDDFHSHVARRTRLVPFGDDTIRVLAAEDLLVCKAVFDRRKDWIDIEQVLLLTAGTLDLAEVRRWLVAILGGGDARRVRFEAAVREVLGDQRA